MSRRLLVSAMSPASCTSSLWSTIWSSSPCSEWVLLFILKYEITNLMGADSLDHHSNFGYNFGYCGAYLGRRQEYWDSNENCYRHVRCLDILDYLPSTKKSWRYFGYRTASLISLEKSLQAICIPNPTADDWVDCSAYIRVCNILQLLPFLCHDWLGILNNPAYRPPDCIHILFGW